MVRSKNRYVLGVVEVFGKDVLSLGLTTHEIFLGLNRTLEACFGGVGLGLARRGLTVQFFDASTGFVLVRCMREELGRVWVGLTLLKTLEGGGGGSVAVAVRVIRVSGTFREPKRELRTRLVDVLGGRVSAAVSVTRRKEERKKLEEVLDQVQKLGA